jgi:hypothetical protein
MLMQSSRFNDKLKEDLQNFYATGDDKYPKKRTDLVHVLDQCTKKVVVKAVKSQGSSFANTGGRGGRGNRNNNNNTNSDKKEPYEKKLWADKECRRCHKKWHPAEHCRAANPASNSDKDKDKDKEEHHFTSGSRKSTKERLKEFKKKYQKFFHKSTRK